MFVRAIFWKELREHRVQALILLGLGIAILAGLLPLLESDFSPDSFRVLLAACFAWACGMVTGAILLANESESMTQMFLDVLPRRRSQLWWSKASFGLVLTVGESLVLAAVCLVLWRPGSAEAPAAIILLNLLGGLFGLSCGLFGSSLGRTVLAAIGWSVVALFGSGFVMAAAEVALLALTALFDDREPKSGEAITMLSFVLAIPLPTALSALFYTRLDRQRSYRLPVLRAPRLGFWAGYAGLMQTLWLSFKQGLVLNLFLGGIALVAGPLLLIDPYAVWPIATLLIGLLAGVGVVGDEQFYGSFRFLAEQRLPLGRIWTLKVASRLVIAVLVASGCLLLGGLVMQLAASVDSRTFSERWLGDDNGVVHIGQMGRFTALSVWLIYGFAFGHLAGMLARKTFIAFAIAFTSAATCLAVWLPSLLGGGLPAWQIFAIPVAILVLSRVLVWKWATERLHSPGSLVALGGYAALGVAFIGLALGNRVWEVPKVSEPFDVAGFESQYPPRVENEVRSKLYSAASKFDDRRNSGLAAPLAPEDEQAKARRLSEVLFAAAEFGWPKNNRRLENLADHVCGGEWMALLKEVAALPPTVVDDPHDLVLSSRLISPSVGSMCHMLGARAMQLQSRGDHAGALDLISTQLALARHVLTRSTSFPFMVGSNIETSALQTLEIWSNQPKVSPDLLERALKLIREHEAKRPPFADNVKAEYLLQREYLAEIGSGMRGNSHNRNWKGAVLATTMMMPWERARRQRMLNALGHLSVEAAAMDFPTTIAQIRSFARPDYSSDKRVVREIYADLPPSKDNESEELKLQLVDKMQTDPWFIYSIGLIRSTDGRRFMGPCRTRAAEIRLALLLFQHRHGRPAAKLDELVPDLLASIPIDPFSEQPFNYRLIDAEEWLLWPKQVPVGAEDWAVEDDPNFRAFAGPMGGGPVAAGAPVGGAPPDQDLVPKKPPQARFRPVMEGELSATHRRVKPGYAVIWSVGPDGVNDGGKENSDSTQIPMGRYSSNRHSDVLFVVPRIK